MLLDNQLGERQAEQQASTSPRKRRVRLVWPAGGRHVPLAFRVAIRVFETAEFAHIDVRVAFEKRQGREDTVDVQEGIVVGLNDVTRLGFPASLGKTMRNHACHHGVPREVP